MKKNQLSGEIEARLEAVRGRIRRVQLVRAATVVATVSLGGLFVLIAVDYFLSPLPAALRWGMTGAWLLAVLAAARFGTVPLLKPIGLLQVARWLEGRHPEMEERLSTVLELSGDPSGVSHELLESLARAAEIDAGKVDVSLEVNAARTTRRWARPAAALAVLMLLALVIWPGETSRMLVRAVAPFSAAGNAGAGRFTVKPGDLEVLEGDAVRIETKYDGRAKVLQLVMHLEGGREIQQELSRQGGIHVYTLEPAKQSFHYQARAGREESDGYDVTVWPLPRLAEASVTLDFPEYTDLASLENPPERGISAVVGTRANLAGRTNTAVELAWLEIGGKRAAEGKVDASANGDRVEFSWTLAAKESGEAVVMLKHRLGRVVEALRFPVEVQEDRVPEVVLLRPSQSDLKVRPDEVLALQYQVTEDFSLSKMAVEAEVSGKPLKTLDLTVPPLVKGSKPPRFRGEAAVSVGELRTRLGGATEFRLRVRAEDSRPKDSAGPGVGFSGWLRIRIDEGAESLARQELRQEHEGAKQTIEEAIRATREARERMDWHREQVKNGELNDKAKKDLNEAGEKLAGAEETLEELSKQMEESVHANKADDVRKAAEMVAKAREDLEITPLQDDKAERETRLDQARNVAEAAVKQLESVRDSMDRSREKIEDLAKLQDLAQQQQEVARQADDNLAKQPDAETPQAWQDRQRQVEEAIKQQLHERPQAKAEILKAQAEQAKAMAGEAKEMAKAQDALKEQAKQLSEKSLKQALSAEQEKIAAKANEQLSEAREARSQLADSLPEATAAAETASDQMKSGDTPAAAKSAGEAAQAMKKAAAETPGEPLQAEALEALAGKQEKLAAAMESLAQGKPEEALKGVQAAQAEAAGDLAEKIESMPMLEQTGHMQEARSAGNQGQQQAQTAAEEGLKSAQQEAAKQHDQSAQSFEKSAAALTRAADEFAQRAEQAAAQAQNPQRAQAPAAQMAEAFQQASLAADSSNPAEAAAQAAQAAQAMAQAAQAARQQMQGGPPSPPSPNGNPGTTPAEKPMEGPREREVDPGVPPELAKLGISSADWEKIEANLKSDVGAGEGGIVPEEYRELVKGYFESMSKKSVKD